MGDCLPAGRDAGQEDVDSGEELFPVVVLTQQGCRLVHERIRVRLRPRRSQGLEIVLPCRVVGDASGPCGVLGGRAENVVDQRCAGIGPCRSGDADPTTVR